MCLAAKHQQFADAHNIAQAFGFSPAYNQTDDNATPEYLSGCIILVAYNGFKDGDQRL